MTERNGIITMKGNPLTLLGPELKPGDAAPGFTVVDNGLAPKALDDFKGKVLILSAVPSLDTPVCDIQTRQFNTRAAALGDDVEILTISMDLPFAQSRWCGAAGVDKVTTLSDHKDASFGEAFGLLIKELRLLARAVVVLDRDRRITHFQIVPEVADEPDYDAVIEAAKAAL